MNKTTVNLILAFLTGATAGVITGMLISNEKKPVVVEKLSKAAGLIADAVKMQLVEEVKHNEHAVTQ